MSLPTSYTCICPTILQEANVKSCQDYDEGSSKMMNVAESGSET